MYLTKTLQTLCLSTVLFSMAACLPTQVYGMQSDTKPAVGNVTSSKDTVAPKSQATVTSSETTMDAKPSMAKPASSEKAVDQKQAGHGFRFLVGVVGVVLWFVSSGIILVCIASLQNLISASGILGNKEAQNVLAVALAFVLFIGMTLFLILGDITKHLFGLETVDSEGKRASKGRLVLRCLLKIGLVGIVDLIGRFTQDGRWLHNRWTGTKVVYMSKKEKRA